VGLGGRAVLETNLFAIRLLSLSAGGLLSVFLAVNLLANCRRTVQDLLLIALACTGASWQVTGALLHYLQVVGSQAGRFAFSLEVTRTVAGWTALAALASLCWIWAGHYRTMWRRTAAASSLKRFFLCFAVSLGVMAAAGASRVDASFLPPFFLIWFIYRYNVFDLLIGRRVLFVFTLAAVSALYLLLVRALAGWLESELDAFGPLVELTLVLGAAVTWLPLYEVITRFFSRQNKLYADLSKKVIEEAARIFDLGARTEYLVEQVGKTFRLRRAVLVLDTDPPLAAAHGEQLPVPALDRIRGFVTGPGSEITDLIHVQRPPVPGDTHILLSELGFNYLLPLRCQGGVNGVLLLDSAPRVFLDDSEATLLGLGREISLSLESCRLAEAKLGLERELMRQQHMAALGRVAATMAHEVKNPLSSIRTLAQLIGEDPEVNARCRRDLEYMVSEIDRLDRCVQQLLTYARPLPEPSAEVRLTELLEDLATFLSPDAARQGVFLECRVAPDLRLVRSDRHGIQQVVLNLLLNAVQASTSGGSVLLDAFRLPGGHIRVAVTDQGPGIPPEIRDRIFEPFFTTKQQGTGLGLAIVQNYVRQLGGFLQLETPINGGRGTCVTVLFPGNPDE